MIPDPFDNQWIPTPWRNWYAVTLVVGGVVLTALFGSALIYSVGTDQVGGLSVAVAIVAGVTGFGLVFDFWFLNLTQPRAIRLSVSGIEVRTVFGKHLRMTWSEVTLAEGRRRGEGLLRVQKPRPQTWFLTRRQYSAAKLAAPLAPGSPP